MHTASKTRHDQGYFFLPFTADFLPFAGFFCCHFYVTPGFALNKALSVHGVDLYLPIGQTNLNKYREAILLPFIFFPMLGFGSAQ